MPVTVKLSRRFYERLGDDITNELVDWFNQVDATYRIELRDLNDRNFARFDARLEQRLAESTALLRSEINGLRVDLKSEIGELRSEFKSDIGELRSEFKSEISGLRGELKAEIGGLHGELKGEIAEWRGDSRAEIAATRASLIKWMFVFWTGTAITNIGTTIALVKLLG